jgi:hypothetical protein
MSEALPGLAETAERLREGADRVLVLGMGGSSLAPLVFASSFPRRGGWPALEVLDSTDPSSVLAAAQASPPERTIYVVSSKSGTTLEPNLFFDWFYEHAGKDGSRFVVITDPGTPLQEVAQSRGVEVTVLADRTIGGRYSALSPFGIVPATLAGFDVNELLRRAKRLADACHDPDPETNPGASLGAAMGALALEGRDKITLSVGTPVHRFGMWLEQLIAESTGKEGKGILPVEGEPLAGPDAYGDDRFFVSIGDREGKLDDLARAGHPVAQLEISDALDLGAQMFRWEFATAIAGSLLGIDPFDQPNVQEAKDRTNEILAGQGGDRGKPAFDSVDGLLASIKPGDYFATTAYIPSTPGNEDRLDRIRIPVRDAKRVATTVGFGPRFLHSTGQLHKGGPDTGVFLQITAEPAAKLPVPGRPWSFEQVIAAQAAGDLAALESRGRRALGVHLPDSDRALDSLADRVAGAARKV